MNRVLVTTALITGMALLGTEAARANVVTQNFDFATLSGYSSETGPTLNGFNTALGTLTSVSVSDSVTATWSGGGATDFNEAEYTIVAGPLDLGLSPVHPGNGSTSDSSHVTTTDPALLTAFTNSSQSTSVSLRNANGTAASISSVFGTGTLTYNYTPAAPVPEPGSLALLGTALIGFGAAGWRLRRRA